jgi:hypothetical protein
VQLSFHRIDENTASDNQMNEIFQQGATALHFALIAIVAQNAQPDSNTPWMGAEKAEAWRARSLVARIATRATRPIVLLWLALRRRVEIKERFIRMNRYRSMKGAAKKNAAPIAMQSPAGTRPDCNLRSGERKAA